ncbi:ABC transporter substrate-binding protein [Microlunatus antarcticus]|uniref:Thiamine pyrimidine synthase n=1 Tax=Microlunatus antarcticus TaxID=53388 RepID=A0A7W5P8T0_9ACTN|nr:ABC transporter substrate-binding protein [Microlunatus antarcticus]MBB3328206.1 NitT/TauT family transport system substrate-binding protein [Microlunatus antarcticus]
MLSLSVSATSHGQNYLPLYYAEAAGLFAARGLEVRVWDRDPWTEVLDDLASGEADVVLGGLWVPAMYAGRGRELVTVGQINARFSKTVITREPVADFDWSWITGRTVLVPGAGGTAPYEFTAGLIRAAGVDPASARFVRDLSGPMLTELFLGGHGDAMVVDAFSAAKLSTAGLVHQTYRLAGPGGVMPNSVFYTDPERLDPLLAPLTAFLAALQEAMDAINAGAATAGLLAEHWPGATEAARAAATAELVENGTWESVVVDEAACNRWMDILREGGLVSTAADYSSLVDTRAVDTALAEPVR